MINLSLTKPAASSRAMDRQGQAMASAAMEREHDKVSGQTDLREVLSGMLPMWWPQALIVLAVLAIRLPAIGNPILDFDEQLYLLVGDRMLHGLWPYVDLWDRKPPGLFAFYAGIRLLGGDGIVQYQAVAAGCVVITSLMIRALVRRWLGEWPGIVVAIGYALLLNILHGAGGQAAVLYNPLTAAAALCAFGANDVQSTRAVAWRALAAMAAMGIAIQFKYTPVVEGAFLGCWFLWRLWQVATRPLTILAIAAGMIALAVLPTALAVAIYAANGHLAEFVQANFVSVFQRTDFPAEERRLQYLLVFVLAAPLMIVGLRGLMIAWTASGTERRSDALLLSGWVASSFAGFLLLGDFFDFYFITVALPLSVAAAWAIRPGLAGFGAACLLLMWPLIGYPAHLFQTAHYRSQTDRMVATLKPLVAGRYLYVYDGPTVLYLLTAAPSPSRYIYPDHLNNPVEAPALGVDPVAEERRILAARPGAIVTADLSVVPRVSPGTQLVLRDALARDYVLVDRVRAMGRTILIWARRDLPHGPSLKVRAREALPQ